MKKANPEVPNFSVIQKKCGDTRPIPEPEDNLYNNCTSDESVSFDEAFVKRNKGQKIKKTQNSEILREIKRKHV